MTTSTTLTATDLFALLDRDFRRRSRACRKCQFSLPYRVFRNGSEPDGWSVIPSEACSHQCQMILEEVVAEYQASWRLSETGTFRAVDV